MQDVLFKLFARAMEEKNGEEIVEIHNTWEHTMGIKNCSKPTKRSIRNYNGRLGYKRKLLYIQTLDNY